LNGNFHQNGNSDLEPLKTHRYQLRVPLRVRQYPSKLLEVFNKGVSMKYKYGRRPARYTYASLARAIVMSRHLKSLGPAPAASPDYVSAVMNQAGSAGWSMDGNDTLGDCTCASSAHQKMLRTANAGTIVIPSLTDVLYLYAVMNGYTGSATDLDAIKAYCTANDNGADELTLEQYLENTGWMGNKLTGFANLDVTQLDELKWANIIFGATRLGVNLPTTAMDQFNAGQPWDYVPGAQLDGGHDVPMVKYDANYVYVVTWGKLQPVTYAFMAAQYDDGTPYVEEAHAELDAEWLEQSGTAPSGLDLAQLTADLSAIVDKVPPSFRNHTTRTPAVSKHQLGSMVQQRVKADISNGSMTVVDMGNDLTAAIRNILASG
jgi:hypothetical protein